MCVCALGHPRHHHIHLGLTQLGVGYVHHHPKNTSLDPGFSKGWLHWLFVCLSVCLSVSVCLFLSVCFCLSVSVCLFLFVCFCLSVSVCLFLSVCFCLSVSVCLFLSVCFCLSVSVCLFLSVCFCLSVSVCMFLSVCFCLSVCLCLSVCFCLSVSVCLFLSVCLCGWLFVCLLHCYIVTNCFKLFQIVSIFVCLFVSLFLCVFVCLLVCLFVCWLGGISLLVCCFFWCAGLLVCWFVGLVLFWLCVGLLVCWFVGFILFCFGLFVGLIWFGVVLFVLFGTPGMIGCIGEFLHFSLECLGHLSTSFFFPPSGPAPVTRRTGKGRRRTKKVRPRRTRSRGKPLAPCLIEWSLGGPWKGWSFLWCALYVSLTVDEWFFLLVPTCIHEYITYMCVYLFLIFIQNTYMYHM